MNHTPVTVVDMQGPVTWRRHRITVLEGISTIRKVYEDAHELPAKR